MRIAPNREGRAISEVLATVILIAITLVAGVAIAGFAFGLFGTLGNAPVIRVLTATCAHPSTLTVTVSNTGGLPGTISGATPSPLFANGTIPANTASQLVVVSGGAFSSGQTITGALLIAGGSSVPFTVTCT